MTQQRVTLREIPGLLACVAAGLCLRVLALSRESAWGDEALTAACHPAGSFRDYLACAFAQDPTIRLAPLYHLVQFGWTRLAGDDLFSLRLLSVTLGTAAMVQLYFLARQMMPAAGARVAVLLIGFSLFQIYYAQEVRVYALLNVLALTSMQGFWRLGNDGAQRGLPLVVLANAALLLTHSFAVLLVAAQGVCLLAHGVRRPLFLRWAASHTALGLAFLAWTMAIGYEFGDESLAYGDRPAGLGELAVTALQFAGGRFSNWNPDAYLAWGLNLEAGILLGVAGLAGAAIAGRLFDRQGRPSSGLDTVVLLLAWLLVPVVLLYVAGRVWRPCFFPRYLVHCAIPFSMLAALGLARIPHAALRRVVATALVAMLLWQNLAAPRPFRADYAALARAVRHDDAVEKSVLALKPFNHRAAAYALRDAPVDVALFYGLKEITGIARTQATEGRSVWVVFYLWDAFETFEDAMAEAGLSVHVIQTAGMPPLRLYHITRDTP